MPLRTARIRAVLGDLLVSMVAAFCLGASALHGKPIEPPLERLYSDDNRLVAGSLIEINPDGRLVFQRRDVLDGKRRPPEKIDVRVPQAALAGVKLGERYIFGYAFGQQDPRNPLGRVANPDGPQLLVGIGLDPGLFRDTPAAREIFGTARSEYGRESRKMLDLLTNALSGPDRALRNLAAGQFALDAEIGERLRERGHAAVEKAARDSSTSADTRAYLLQAAAQRPQDLGGWWQDLAVDLVTTTPTGGYSTSPEGLMNLALTALDLLDQHAITVPPGALKRWVWSENPALAERASLMLRRQSPALERSTIQQALADPALPAATRKFLEGHLRRLDRLDAPKKTPGSG